MHMRQMLREVSIHRTVGLSDAVNDLGTHLIHGCEVPYSRQMISLLLKGKVGSKNLLKRVVDLRPDLLELSWVDESVIERARQLGWAPRTKRARAKSKEGTIV